MKTHLNDDLDHCETNAEIAPGISILIVEDDDLTGMSLCGVLKRAGYCVTTVTDGTEAIQKIQDHVFDIVITDIHVPGESGLEILRVARSLKRPTAVILVSADSTFDTVIDAIRAGAYEYVIKPFLMEDFLIKVKVAVRRHISEIIRLNAVRSIANIVARLRESHEEFLRNNPEFAAKALNKKQSMTH
jgi:DNA-binding response OmpR family regulator